jgi:sugar/nucleoside kinase (ribokinase family)
VSHVVCIGLATLDTIYRLPRHPGPEDRVVASEVVVAGGGPAATAAVTLARLGVETYFVGAVGDDPAGHEIRRSLEDEGVDASELRAAGARSALSTILVGDGTRAIVTVPGPPVELSPRARELCRDADWVHVDHAGYRAAPRDGVRHSIDGGNPIPGLDLRGVALYVPTERELLRVFPGGGPEAVHAGAEVVVATRGPDGCAAWTAAGEELTSRIESRDEIVSTLGAGDVFHGALLAGLVDDLPLAKALELANWCAARSCRALDGRSASPTASDLEAVPP